LITENSPVTLSAACQGISRDSLIIKIPEPIFCGAPTKPHPAKAGAGKPRVLASSALDDRGKDPKMAGLPKALPRWKSLRLGESREVAMAKLSRKTTIHARAEDVFNFLEDKTHVPEFWPSMIAVSDIRDLPNGGKQYHWIYKMAGLRFEGDSEEIEVIPNQKLVSKNKKGIESTITWLMEGHGDDTDLTFEVDYKVPVPVLGKLAEKIVVKLNENEADAMIANLKTQIEA
jgi:uncharacterized membrane protein